MRDLESADERKYRYAFTAIGNFGKLDSEVVDVGLEDIPLPHSDGEEVMVVLLNVSARDVLSEKHPSYLLKAVKRM